MKKTSVEYAHIYTNSKISEEHELSLRTLDQFDRVETSFVVLVDDYSFPDPTFDYEVFTKWLADHGHEPSVVIRESQLISQCDEVLKIMEEGKLKEETIEYIKDKKKYPCSLFIAAWYLLRLGKLEHPEFSELDYADSLVNILPESFKPYEDRAVQILQKTPYADLVANITNDYLPGRSIA